MRGVRLLGAIRLSRDTDETTSPLRQRQAIEAFAATHGHTVTHIAEDIDVSGAIPPADRPQLGPWLARSDEWDALIVAKPDRLSRSLRDFLNLHHELTQHGKAIISIDPALDFSSDMGRLVASILLSFAEFERGMIAARVRDSYRHIKQGGGYAGGPVPFGYLVRQRDTGTGWEYAHDPEFASVVREMAERAIGGESMRQIAISLNERGVPTSQDVVRRRAGRDERGTRWSVPSVKAVFTNPAIAGLQNNAGKPLRDGAGMAIKRCEGILTRDEWERLKLAIDRPAQGAHRVDANPLLHVAYCAADGRALYSTGPTGRERSGWYYVCAGKLRDSGCPGSRIRAGDLEELTGYVFLAQVGHVEFAERVLIPGEDHAGELAEVADAIAGLDEELEAGNLHPRAYARMITPLEHKRDALAALPSRAARIERRPTGETYAQRWEHSDPTERRKLMTGAGFEIWASKVGAELTFAFKLDPELAARAQAAAAGEAVELPGHGAVQRSWESPDVPESDWTPAQRDLMERLRGGQG